MEVELGFAKKRTRRAVRPEFATLVAVAVARQSASRTAQVLAAADGGRLTDVSLVDLFNAARVRGSLPSGCFNSGVAALLSPRQRT
jgi:hypothetical protein